MERRNTKYSRFLATGITGRVTLRFVIVAALSILVFGLIGYSKIYKETAKNSEIRVERAGHAAAFIFAERFGSEFEMTTNSSGDLTALRLKAGTIATSLTYRDEYDTLLASIGKVNEGAANLFKFNTETSAFDRFVTTFRTPSGEVPPPMSIGVGHPAYQDLLNVQIHCGEVPVMGRMRLAKIIPILDVNGAVVGAFAVDVGWVDDLIIARDELLDQSIWFAICILGLQAILGGIYFRRELSPIRTLAKYADDMALENYVNELPFQNHNDEIGMLAVGLNHVNNLHGKLAHLAYTDELTGLGNRSRYLADLEAGISLIGDGAGPMALLHLNLDNFGHVNETYGNDAGDVVLKVVAERIQKVVGKQVNIARISGAEFAMIVNGALLENAASVTANRLIDTLHDPIRTETGDINISGSVGFVDCLGGLEDRENAQFHVHLALRTAQQAGGDQVAKFSSKMRQDYRDKIAAEGMLGNAITNREIEIHFQPQVNLLTNEISGLEALARWTHPSLGQVPPNKFIPMAEESGQIVNLGNLIIDLACQQAAQWYKDGFNFKHISINVSPIQLWRTDLFEVLRDALERHEIPGELICIEITEGVFIDQSNSSILSTLDRIRGLGAMLSLDDFGTGYSALGYLSHLPFDQVKIDRSFVADISSDTRRQEVLRGILGFVKGLNFNIIVEGPETIEEIRTIYELGGEEVQGFFYAKPAPAALVPNIINNILKSPPMNGGLSDVSSGKSK